MTDQLFSHLLMPLAIAYIMFGIGVNLDIAEFKKTFNRPKALFVGLFAQMILLPALAFLLNTMFDIDPVYKVGLVLIAACPGGTTSNIVTLLLRGRLALSVTLTAFNSTLILITIPLIMKAALGIYEGLEQDIEMPIGQTMGNMFLTLLLPTLTGMAYRHYFPGIVYRTSRIINVSMTVFLLFVFIGIFAFESTGSSNIGDYAYLLVPTFLLNAVSMFVGYGVARMFSIANRGRFTIAIQVGLQNSALAIYVAGKLLGQPEMAVIAVIYGSFTLFTTTFWAFIMKKLL